MIGYLDGSQTIYTCTYADVTSTPSIRNQHSLMNVDINLDANTW